MPTHVVTTFNTPRPRRAWSVAKAITPSDTNSQKNLEINGYPFRFIQNIGTSGAGDILWSDGNVVSFWFTQGTVYEGGHWVHVRTTNLGAGVVLRGLVGDESYSD